MQKLKKHMKDARTVVMLTRDTRKKLEELTLTTGVVLSEHIRRSIEEYLAKLTA